MTKTLSFLHCKNSMDTACWKVVSLKGDDISWIFVSPGNPVERQRGRQTEVEGSLPLAAIQLSFGTARVP